MESWPGSRSSLSYRDKTGACARLDDATSGAIELSRPMTPGSGNRARSASLRTTHRLFATTPKNMEPLLVDELRALGVRAHQERAGARFRGTLEAAYRTCLWSRVASRVLLLLARVPAATPEALYAGVQTVPWHAHFEPTNTFAVHLTTSQSRITHSHFGALKVKDAVVDQFRQRYGSRPSVQTQRPDLLINVYLIRDVATISLDLSGESLHRRGYRERGVAAPLKENLAAAILLRAGWPEIAHRGGALIDPVCGSGTLPIEAGLMAADVAPGLQRDYWGFLGWKQHDAALWDALLREARSRRTQGLLRLPSIRGYDADFAAVDVARANAERAGLAGRIHIEQADVETCAPSRPQDCGLLIANPPYGERLGSEADLRSLYARLGRTVKERFAGWRAAVLTGNPDLGKALGIHPKRVHPFYNGRLECELLVFDVPPKPSAASVPVLRGRSPSADMLANRLRKNRKHLGRWLEREDIHCYRLYDADLPEYAMAIDIYEGEKRWVHVQEYEAPKSVDRDKARVRLQEALAVIRDVLDIPEDQLFLKVRRRQRGRAQYGKLADTRRFHEVTEAGCRFLVNFEDYLDTGLFLDHRITRKLISELAAGRCFLNLFAYTGAATVYAAKGGASSTTTVDMSNTYLGWARRNMVLNGFVGDCHEFEQADCLEWLDEAAGRRQYQLIFLDPPTFSTSKRMVDTFDVQRDHVALIRKTTRLLDPDGVLIFSNNLRRFKMDFESLDALSIEDISRSTLPRDFERSRQIHSCWRIRWRRQEAARSHGSLR